MELTRKEKLTARRKGKKTRERYVVARISKVKGKDLFIEEAKEDKRNKNDIKKRYQTRGSSAAIWNKKKVDEEERKRMQRNW